MELNGVEIPNDAFKKIETSFRFYPTLLLMLRDWWGFEIKENLICGFFLQSLKLLKTCVGWFSIQSFEKASQRLYWQKIQSKPLVWEVSYITSAWYRLVFLDLFYAGWTSNHLKFHCSRGEKKLSRQIQFMIVNKNVFKFQPEAG